MYRRPHLNTSIAEIVNVSRSSALPRQAAWSDTRHRKRSRPRTPSFTRTPCHSWACFIHQSKPWNFRRLARPQCTSSSAPLPRNTTQQDLGSPTRAVVVRVHDTTTSTVQAGTYKAGVTKLTGTLLPSRGQSYRPAQVRDPHAWRAGRTESAPASSLGTRNTIPSIIGRLVRLLGCTLHMARKTFQMEAAQSNRPKMGR